MDAVRIAILGPTASGKSALAVEVARRLGGTVVNGDPFQALLRLPIGTGQPTAAERGGVPHVGYGVLPLETRLNAQDFGSQVRQWMSPLPAAVLVTGSGLYLRGIWEQLDALPDVPVALVARVRAWGERLGAPALHRFLAAVDPLRAGQLHPNDSGRIQRALALHLATGGRASSLMTGVSRELPAGWRAVVVLPSREVLRKRVRRRVRAMVEAGWAQEVQRVVAEGHGEDLRRLRPLGYLDWLAGGPPREIEARIVQATQAYAKRQDTWFRGQLPGIPRWDPDTEPLEDALTALGLPSPSA